MGALTDIRKRRFTDPSSTSSSFPSKKPRLISSSPISSNVSKPPSFIRIPHAPQPIIHCFGLGSPYAKRRNPVITFETEKFFSPSVLKKRSERLELDLEEYKQLVEESSAFPGDVGVKAISFLKKSVSPDLPTRNETKALDGSDVTSHKAEDGRNMELDSGQMSEARISVKPEPLYKRLYEKTKVRDELLNDLGREVKLQRRRVIGFRIESKLLRKSAKKSREEVGEFFHPLTPKEEEDISDALVSSSSHKVLIAHKSSNIEITREALQCLRPGAWLNDEVINLYLELLKEREKRNPKMFFRCHYFNTFFFKKLISEKHGYDFKAVKRWTTQRKLGYALIECDKIFVPIHKDIHWCLAVINVKDESFQYLDSLGGLDRYVLKMLAKYFKDEVRDKNAKEIDTLNWKKESVDDLPLQKNGWDCGMFMLKYADFCSRGLNLCFSQEHMTYFRRKTVLELLRLRVD